MDTHSCNSWWKWYILVHSFGSTGFVCVVTVAGLMRNHKHGKWPSWRTSCDKVAIILSTDLPQRTLRYTGVMLYPCWYVSFLCVSMSSSGLSWGEHLNGNCVLKWLLTFGLEIYSFRRVHVILLLTRHFFCINCRRPCAARSTWLNPVRFHYAHRLNVSSSYYQQLQCCLLLVHCLEKFHLQCVCFRLMFPEVFVFIW